MDRHDNHHYSGRVICINGVENSRSHPIVVSAAACAADTYPVVPVILPPVIVYLYGLLVLSVACWLLFTLYTKYNYIQVLDKNTITIFIVKTKN